MGIKEFGKKLLGKRKIATHCHMDKDTGKINCERKETLTDGTEINLASATYEFTGGCNPVLVDSNEEQEGEFDELEKAIKKKLTSQCNKSKNVPADI